MAKTQHHEQSGEAGRDIIGDVIDMGSPATEIAIALCLVANHRVEGVHHLIG